MRWGFVSATHFNRSYMARHGVSPRTFRQRQLAGVAGFPLRSTILDYSIKAS